MTEFANVKACVFDAYGTLFDVHSPVGRVAETLGDKAQAVSATWREKQLQYTWLRSLMRAHADFWQVTGEALDYALNLHGIDDAGIHDKLMQAYLTLDAYPDAAPALAELKGRGLKTAILSNGSPRMLEAAVSSAGIGDALDAVLSVEDVGIYKPAPRVYRMAVTAFDVDPYEVCFVSANGWDVAGAAHFGFQVAWLNRFGLAPERLPGKPAAVIEGLDALPSLVSAG
jgi:2-haloacid dehalogenase